MDIEHILNQFFSEVPQMKELFEIMCEIQGISMVDGRAAVWKIGVMECIGFLLNESSEFLDLTRSVFAFLEKLAKADKETRDFFWYGTMSYFFEKTDVQKKAMMFMGPETKKLWVQYCSFEKDAQLWQLSQLYSDEELEAMKQA